MKKLEDVGEHAHGGNIGPRSRSLDDKRGLVVPTGRDSYDIVTSAGSGKRMLNGDFDESGFGRFALKRSDITQNGMMSLRLLEPGLHERIELAES